MAEHDKTLIRAISGELVHLVPGQDIEVYQHMSKRILDVLSRMKGIDFYGLLGQNVNVSMDLDGAEIALSGQIQSVTYGGGIDISLKRRPSGV